MCAPRVDPLSTPLTPGLTLTSLATLKSPFSSTLTEESSTFLGCGATTGHTHKFYVMLQPGSSISIGQINNTFDSQHSAFWSESSDPTSYPSYPVGSYAALRANGTCTDEPDTQTIHMTNTDCCAARKMWFVLNGYSSNFYQHETQFTLAWEITGGSTP